MLPDTESKRSPQAPGRRSRRLFAVVIQVAGGIKGSVKPALVLAFSASLSACGLQGATTRASVETIAALPPVRSFATAAVPAPSRSNADMARDFLDLHFQLESGTALAVFTRFEHPVTLRIIGAPTATLRQDLQALLKRLRREARINISLLPSSSKPVATAPHSAASITIEAVSRARIQRVLPQAACFVVPNVSSLDEYARLRRAPQTDWSTLRRRERLAIFVPNDVSPQELRDCLHEELAQALGPLNDLYRLSDSVFNDDNVRSILTGFDMLVLRATYDPALRTGMSRAEVAARIPALLARLNPAGERRRDAPLPATPRSWIHAIEAALGSSGTRASHERATHQAAQIAKAQGWTDHRRAFGHFLVGRLEQSRNPDLAQAHFRTALQYLGDDPNANAYRALIETRMAAYDISRGQLDTAEAHLNRAQPIAIAEQNAALLSTHMLMRAEILQARGDLRAAETERAQSVGWALYGFGTEATVAAHLREVAALSPASQR